jgi:hypothetical protein
MSDKFLMLKKEWSIKTGQESVGANIFAIWLDQRRDERKVAEGWIKWDGDHTSMPIRSGCRVDIKFRDGVLEKNAIADGYRWNHLGNDNDIVAYRMVSADADKKTSKKQNELRITPEMSQAIKDVLINILYEHMEVLTTKPAHDYTPHPWSEPVPCKGEYLAFIRKTKEWCDGGIFDAEEQEQTTGFSHWMHMPPSPTEVE